MGPLGGSGRSLTASTWCQAASTSPRRKTGPGRVFSVCTTVGSSGCPTSWRTLGRSWAGATSLSRAAQPVWPVLSVPMLPTSSVRYFAAAEPEEEARWKRWHCTQSRLTCRVACSFRIRQPADPHS